MSTSRNHTCKKARPGYTLPEATAAAVLLAMAAAGVLLPFSSGAAARAQGRHRTLAAKLANDLIEQVITAPFDQIVATYNGYAEPQGQIKDASGTVFDDANYANFSRKVSAQYVYVSQQAGTVEPNFILVTVGLYYRGRQIVAINRLISE